MTEPEVKVIVDKLADIARVLADPDGKAEIFRRLGLKLTYQSSRQVVEQRSGILIVDNSMVSEVRLHQKAKTRYPY